MLIELKGRINLALLIVLFFTIPAFSQQRQDSTQQKPKPVRVSPVRELQSDLDALIDNSDFSNAFIGISVLSLENGESIYKKNDQKNYVPASNLKLLTTAAALEYLGKDFKFYTRLYLDGTIQQNGEFVGNIIIKGTGDPTLSEYFFKDPLEILDNWVQQLEAAGIKSIRGNIIGDDYYFDHDYYAPGWSWDDLSYPYASQVNALSIFDNKIDILILPDDSIGYPAKFSIYPENSYIQVINNLRTVPLHEFTSVNVTRDPQSNIIELNGIVRLDTSKSKEPYKTSVTIDNPTRFFLNLFRESLNRKSIRFRGALFDIEDWNERISYSEIPVFCEHESPALSEIIAIINKHSHNLATDIILKTLGKEMLGTGSFPKGIEIIRKYCVNVGIDPDKISLNDGSGLSRYNLLSPKYLVGLLYSVSRKPYSATYINSLAQPGQPGTLNRRMTKSRAEKNVNAKTGSMNNISTLSGYVTTRDKEVFAFSIMISNFTVPMSLAENLEDLICMRLASFTRK